MLTDEMVEAAARAMDAAMAYEVERDVLACDLTREEQRKVAIAALTAALPLIRAQVFDRIEHELKMTALTNVENSTDWIDGFEFAWARTRAAIKENTDG